MSKIITLFLVFFIYQGIATAAQAPVTRSITSFGAKGDGTTNDTEAFLKAAVFLPRGAEMVRLPYHRAFTS